METISCHNYESEQKSHYEKRAEMFKFGFILDELCKLLLNDTVSSNTPARTGLRV